MRDCVGQEIVVGSVITYPGRRGSTLWMNTGIVREIYDFGKSEGLLDVERVDATWRFDEGENRYRFKKTVRNVVIGCIDRVTVTSLTPEQLHERYENVQ